MYKSIVLSCLILIGHCFGAATSEHEEKPFLEFSTQRTKTQTLEWIQQQQTTPDFPKRFEEFREACRGIQVEFADLYAYGLSPTSGIFTDLVWHRCINFTDRIARLFRDPSQPIFETFYSDLFDNLRNGRIVSLSLDMGDFLDQPDISEKLFHIFSNETGLQTLTLKGKNHLFIARALQSLSTSQTFETLKLEGVFDNMSLILIADELKKHKLKGLSLTIPGPGIFESGPTSVGYMSFFTALKSCTTIQFFEVNAPFLSSQPHSEPHNLAYVKKDYNLCQIYLIDFLNNSNITHFCAETNGCICSLLIALLSNPRMETVAIGDVAKGCDYITLIYHLYQNKTLQNLKCTPCGFDTQILHELIKERFECVKEDGQ